MVRGVQHDRVVGRDHRGGLPFGVAAVAGLLRVHHLGQRRRVAAGHEFAVAAQCPFAGVGFQEEFTLRARKDNRSLIAPLGNQIAAGRADALLQRD